MPPAAGTPLPDLEAVSGFAAGQPGRLAAAEGLCEWNDRAWPPRFRRGQIGWTAEQTFATDDFLGQFEQALRNTVAVLAAADAKPEHIARMTWYIIDKGEYLARLPEIGRCWRQIIGRHFPAMAWCRSSPLSRTAPKISRIGRRRRSWPDAE